MFAIQYSWPREGKSLKAAQVIYWLRLVAVHYKHLRDDLAERFPLFKNLNLTER
jgi:hypothetical protein